MKFGKIVIAAAFGLTGLMASFAHAGDQDFRLVNHTGCTIAKVLVSPHDEKSWGEDIMGQDVLANDEKVDIKFHCHDEAEYWDLKIVDKEGTEVVWNKLNLLKISKVVLKIEDGKATAEVE